VRPPSEWSIDYDNLAHERDKECRARSTSPGRIRLREVEIVLGQGGTTAEACRRIAVSKQIYCRWRKEYGGLKTEQARRMKDLERENLRLGRAISNLTLDKLICQGRHEETS
jgi:putative transposase